MQPSDKCRSLAKNYEGLVLHEYLDDAGIPTIGRGHKLFPGEEYPGGITEEQADEIFEKDLCKACNQVQKAVKVVLTQGQLDALTDFVFNLGIARLLESTLLKDLNQGQYGSAGAQLLLWDHIGHTEIESLKERRAKEFALWEGN